MPGLQPFFVNEADTEPGQGNGSIEMHSVGSRTPRLMGTTCVRCRPCSTCSKYDKFLLKQMIDVRLLAPMFCRLAGDQRLQSQARGRCHRSNGSPLWARRRCCAPAAAAASGNRSSMGPSALLGQVPAGTQCLALCSSCVPPAAWAAGALPANRSQTDENWSLVS